MGGANQSISAGLGGFLAFFVLAVALWLLMRNMNTRLRNVRYREEAEDAMLAEQGVEGPRRRQIFLPVRDDEPATPGDSTARRDGDGHAGDGDGAAGPGSDPRPGPHPQGR